MISCSGFKAFLATEFLRLVLKYFDLSSPPLGSSFPRHIAITLQSYKQIHRISDSFFNKICLQKVNHFFFDIESIRMLIMFFMLNVFHIKMRFNGLYCFSIFFFVDLLQMRNNILLSQPPFLSIVQLANSHEDFGLAQF